MNATYKHIFWKYLMALQKHNDSQVKGTTGVVLFAFWRKPSWPFENPHNKLKLPLRRKPLTNTRLICILIRYEMN